MLKCKSCHLHSKNIRPCEQCSLYSNNSSQEFNIFLDLIDPELLELSTSPSINLPPIKDSGSAKLTKLLASLKTNSSSPSATSQHGVVFTQKEEESLSQEAKNVIKKLPDLSYMRSKVLMFPVNIMSRVKMSDQ